jgi:hypothetical protein
MEFDTTGHNAHCCHPDEFVQIMYDGTYDCEVRTRVQRCDYYIPKNEHRDTAENDEQRSDFVFPVKDGALVGFDDEVTATGRVVGFAESFGIDEYPDRRVIIAFPGFMFYSDPVEVPFECVSPVDPKKRGYHPYIGKIDMGAIRKQAMKRGR